MYWQAAATDPEIAADWEATMADRRRTMDEVVSYVLSEYLHEARDLGGGLRGDHALHERGAHAALLGGARPRLREGLRGDAPAT
jgi:hypothetical protein